MAFDISLRNPGAAFGIEFGSIVTIAGEVIEAQAKQTEAVTGTQAFSGAVAETQKVQTEAATGTLSITGAVIEDQPQQTEAITGTIPAPAITGTVDESQPKQEEAIRCFQASHTRPITQGYWTGPIQKIEVPEPEAIGVVVNEKTRPQREVVRGRLAISAMVNEKVTVQSRMTGTVGRSRALRELDIAAILNAVA